MENTFIYFGFASNLLQQRLQLSCPSAVRKNIAKLEGYKLIFNGFGNRWKGAVATVTKDKDSVVWGSVWEINKKDKEALDRQEGVLDGIYKPVEVSVETPDGQNLACSLFQIADAQPQEPSLPSVVYKNVIISGAIESGLPHDYVESLKAIPDNGYDGPVEINLSLKD